MFQLGDLAVLSTRATSHPATIMQQPKGDRLTPLHTSFRAQK
jgi:hypothetical protein